MKEFNSFLLVASLVLVGSFFPHIGKAEAATDIVPENSGMTGPNQLTIIFYTAGDTLVAAPITAYGAGHDGVGALTLVMAGGVRDIVSLDSFDGPTNTAVYTFSGPPVGTGESAFLSVDNPTEIVDANGDTFDPVEDPVSFPDRQVPVFVSAVATSDTTIVITFSEGIELVNLDGSDFTIDGEVVTAAALNILDTTQVILAVDPLANPNFTSSGGLHVASDAVEDFAVNSIAASSEDIEDGQSPLTPLASPVAGTYKSTQDVVLSSEGSQTIRYSLDGSLPDCSADFDLYAGPITVSSSKTIKAIGCDDAGNFSAVETFRYVIRTGSTSGGYVSRPPVNSVNTVSCSPGDLLNVTTGERCNAFLNPPAPGALGYAFGSVLVKLGTKGDACKAWQMFFNDKTGAHLVLDSNCGPKTMAVARIWQAAVGLKADGLLGPLSRAEAMTE